MRDEIIARIDELFNLCENLSEKNFAKIIELASQTGLTARFVKFGYDFGNDIIWDIGIDIEAGIGNCKGNRIYGSLCPTGVSSDADAVLSYALRVCEENGFWQVPVYVCFPDNVMISNQDGREWYIIIDTGKLNPMYISKFEDKLEKALNSRIVAD